MQGALLRVLLISVSVAAVLFIGACATLPGIGAGALLHPAKNRNRLATPGACADETFTGAGVMLRGWRYPTAAARRGTIVYEKQDLARVVDTLGGGPVVLIGDSLGGAVALQEAAQDPRITAVVAAETFSDLRTVATERAPRVFTPGVLRRAFRKAADNGHFDIDAVSPARAATGIHVPVLLIHGDADVDTRPDHSRRIFAALAGPKRLILVPGGTHNSSLRPDVWREIDRWIDGVLPIPRPATPSGRAG